MDIHEKFRENTGRYQQTPMIERSGIKKTPEINHQTFATHQTKDQDCQTSKKHANKMFMCFLAAFKKDITSVALQALPGTPVHSQESQVRFCASPLLPFHELWSLPA